VTISGFESTKVDGDWVVATATTTVANLMFANSDAEAGYAVVGATALDGTVFRVYDSMSSRSHATTADQKSPPLHNNYRTSWVTVTDQRPLVWSTPDIDKTTQSRILGSPSLVNYRGVVSGGSNAITFTVDGVNTIITTTSATIFTLTTNTLSINLLNYLGYDNAGTPTTQVGYVTISGCSSNSVVNAEFPLVSVTATVLTVLTAESGSNAIPNTATMCTGNTITITSRMGGLIDSKAIAINDRVKVQEADSVYQTRTVDKIWGSALDVTMFTTVDAYTDSGSLVENLQDLTAWVDESGSTENVECSRRGLCDQESGQCACFPGYTSNNCGTQNALAS
jgi:hypothetical protein